jgi:hypothetical protein
MVEEVFDEHRLPGDFAKNVINGLEKAHWGGGQRENSVVGALAAALEAMDESIPYYFLMGVSAGAFRLQIAHPDWCPSAPHANAGFRLYPVLNEALPFELLHVEPEQGGEVKGRRAPQALLESIDQGVPAFYSKEEESLVVGYEKQGTEVQGGADPLARAGGRARPLGADRQVRGGLCRLRVLDREPARRLDRQGEMIGNGFCYYSLIDARAAAIQYLNEISPELGAEAEKHLKQAAEHYSGVVKALMPRNPTEIAPMPWMPHARDWNQELRDEQAELLEEALAVERRAVAEIEEALAAIGR